MKLTGINIYPVKSLQGISLQNSFATKIGLSFDRRWMLVDQNGKFITQRTHPILSQIKTSLSDEKLICSLEKDNTEPIQILLNQALHDSKSVQVWKSELDAKVLPTAASQWFSSILKTNCSLVYMEDQTSRLRQFDQAPYESHVSFADGYPFLFINESSLEDLNQRVDEEIQINRFRANMIINGLKAYEEEQLNEFSIGDATFKMIKPCARCIMININPETSERGKEPLQTLSTFRKKGNKVYFGMNAVCINPGQVQIGDSLQVS